MRPIPTVSASLSLLEALFSAHRGETRLSAYMSTPLNLAIRVPLPRMGQRPRNSLHLLPPGESLATLSPRA